MGKIRWDSSADQILLTKILETHELSVDVARVAEAWPAEDGAKPTPRAIKERIAKIKELSKNASAAAGSPVTPKKRTPRKRATDDSANDTPTKKRKIPTKVNATATATLAVKEEEPLFNIKHEPTDSDDEELFNGPTSVTKHQSHFDDEISCIDPCLREGSGDPTLSQEPIKSELYYLEEHASADF